MRGSSGKMKEGPEVNPPKNLFIHTFNVQV